MGEETELVAPGGRRGLVAAMDGIGMLAVSSLLLGLIGVEEKRT